MDTLTRADAHWILTGYQLTPEAANAILDEMERREIVWTSDTLRTWRHHPTA